MKDKWALDSNKLLWHMDRVHKHFVRGKRIAPVMIDAGITKRCNIKCEFCYGIHQGMNGAIIPREPLIKLFREAPKAGIKAIAVVGDGEPTLNPALEDAICAGAAHGLDMAVATNGVRMGYGLLFALVQRLVWLRFNLSAVGENYKVVHGAPVWDKVKANILEAVAIRKRTGAKCTIGLQMVLTENAFKSVMDEAQFAIDAGVDYFVIKQCSDPKNDRMVVPLQEWFDKPGVVKVLKDAEAMSTPKTQIIVKFAAIASRIRRPYDHCLDVPLLFQMSGDGKCYPCGYLFGDERYCYGDITKQSLGEILASEHYWKIIEHMQKKFDVHKDCAGHCRHQSTNEFIHKFVNRPQHINFL
jgi:radical SAM protein with 4Fe4S-binding SPASM domain